jgi:hypothetical protein
MMMKIIIIIIIKIFISRLSILPSVLACNAEDSYSGIELQQYLRR